MNYKNIEPQEFSDLMNQDGYVVLDVRSELEASERSIPGSKLINIMSPVFQSEIEKLDKSKKYLVYCRSGNRSGSACSYMDTMGFENLHNLAGGIIAWNRFQSAA